MSAREHSHAWAADIDAFVAQRRTTGLAVSPDGTRVVATVQESDDTRYVSSLWELDGSEAVRLTRSEKGETAPAFLPDGSLLFASTRPADDVAEDDAALWRLPRTGEP